MRESVRESKYRTWRWSVGRPFVCQVALLQLRSRVFYFSCVLCCVMFFFFIFPLMTSLLDRSLCCSPQREAAEKHTDWGGDDLKDSERTADCMRNKRHETLISLTLRHDTCLWPQRFSFPPPAVNYSLKAFSAVVVIFLRLSVFLEDEVHRVGVTLTL